MGADKLQRLSILGVFVAGMMDKSLNDLAGVIVAAIHTGNVSFGQTTFFDFTFCAAQIPGTIQISQLAALAGFLKFTAGHAVCTAATDFFCAIHAHQPLSV